MTVDADVEETTHEEMCRLVALPLGGVTFVIAALLVIPCLSSKARGCDDVGVGFRVDADVESE